VSPAAKGDERVWREVLNSSCAIVVGAGGGGDVSSAYLVARMLESSGLRTALASLVWERLVYDPEPGPLPLEHLSGNIELLEWAGVAYGLCWAIRRGVAVYPSACKLAAATRRPVGLLDCSKGELGVRLGILELSHLFSCDTIVAVDVGGDVVARGCEEELWSPLADSLTLAGLAQSGLRGYVAVYAPGADGELTEDQVLERISELHEAYVAGFGIPRWLIIREGWVVRIVGSEASRMPIDFLLEGPGEAPIRGGVRRVRRGAHLLIGFILEASRLYNSSELAKAVTGTSTVEEASERLNEISVYTELDLERDLTALGGVEALEKTPQIVERLRAEGRKRLGWKRCHQT
jgi:hypothetical protein